MTVPSLQGLENSGLDLAGFSLPCAETQLTVPLSVNVLQDTPCCMHRHVRDLSSSVKGDLSSERHGEKFEVKCGMLVD